MKELPISIQQKIDRYQPVTVGDFTLYPVTVEKSRLFSMARPALEFAQQSLPVALLNVPILDAFYRLELQSAEQSGAVTGIFHSAILALALSLRLVDGVEPEELLENVLIVPDAADRNKLREVRFLTEAGTLSVSPRQFQRMRPIMAAQNGAETPDETANPEILEMERLMSEKDAEGLDPKLWEKIIYVAQGNGISEDEIYDWPILKLERHTAALTRKTDYLAAQLALMTGMVKFKDGNPVPSPYFSKRKTGLSSMRSLDSAGNGADAAVRNKQNQTENTT